MTPGSEDKGLPKRWARCTLGDLIEIIRGVSYKKDQASKAPGNGLVPIVRATNINQELDFDDLVYVPQERVSDDQMLRTGDIVIAASSGSRSVVGKAAQLTQPWSGSFGAFCMGLRPTRTVDSKYISCFLQTQEYRHKVSLLSAGSNINNLKRDHIQSLSFRLAPLPEQHRIVAKIEELFSALNAGVAALERAQANLKRYRASVLKAAVEGKLTEQWRKDNPPREPASELLKRILTERRRRWEQDQLAKYKAKAKQPPKNWKDKYKPPAEPDTKGLPKLPEGWCWATIEQLAEVGTGTTPKRAQSKYYNGGTIPWVTSTAVNHPFVSKETEFVTEAALAETSLRLYPKHTLIIALYGEGKTRGKVSELLVEATINQALGALVMDGPLASCRTYLKTYLQANYVRLRRKAAGGMQPNLNLGLVKATLVALPPLDEQQQIVQEVESRLSIADSVERQAQADLQRATRLRQSILKRAFEGKLVPQDPSDEPAAKVLAAARAQGENQSSHRTSDNGRTNRRRNRGLSQ